MCSTSAALVKLPQLATACSTLMRWSRLSMFVSWWWLRPASAEDPDLVPRHSDHGLARRQARAAIGLELQVAAGQPVLPAVAEEDRIHQLHLQRVGGRGIADADLLGADHGPGP